MADHQRLPSLGQGLTFQNGDIISPNTSRQLKLQVIQTSQPGNKSPRGFDAKNVLLSPQAQRTELARSGLNYITQGQTKLPILKQEQFSQANSNMNSPMIQSIRGHPFAATQKQRQDLEQKIHVVGYVEQNTKFMFFEKGFTPMETCSFRMDSNIGNYKRKSSNYRNSQVPKHSMNISNYEYKSPQVNKRNMKQFPPNSQSQYLKKEHPYITQNINMQNQSKKSLFKQNKSKSNVNKSDNKSYKKKKSTLQLLSQQQNSSHILSDNIMEMRTDYQKVDYQMHQPYQIKTQEISFMEPKSAIQEEDSLEKMQSIQRFKSIEQDDDDPRVGYFEMQQVRPDEEILSYEEVQSDEYSLDDDGPDEMAKSKTAQEGQLDGQMFVHEVYQNAESENMLYKKKNTQIKIQDIKQPKKRSPRNSQKKIQTFKQSTKQNSVSNDKKLLIEQPYIQDIYRSHKVTQKQMNSSISTQLRLFQQMPKLPSIQKPNNATKVSPKVNKKMKKKREDSYTIKVQQRQDAPKSFEKMLNQMQKISKTPLNIKSKNIHFAEVPEETPVSSQFQEDLMKIKMSQEQYQEMVKESEEPPDQEEDEAEDEEEDPPINYKFYNIDGAPTQKHQARKRNSIESTENPGLEKSLSRRRLGEQISIQVPDKHYNQGSQKHLGLTHKSSYPKITKIYKMDPKEKAQKFQELMKAGSETFQQLEGLNNRFKQGVGQGKGYYDAQMKIRRRKEKNYKPRKVLFQNEPEPGSAYPQDFDEGGNSPSPSPKKQSKVLNLEKLKMEIHLIHSEQNAKKRKVTSYNKSIETVDEIYSPTRVRSPERKSQSPRKQKNKIYL